MVKIQQYLIPADRKPQYVVRGVGYTYKMNPKYITIHETDNWNHGAGANAHARLQYNGNSRNASWHLQVDDREAIQSLPFNEAGIAAGDGINGKGNRESIHIEMCVNPDSNYAHMVDNVISVVKYLMATYNIPASRVVQHGYWSGKNCPRYMRAGSKGVNWTSFQNRLGGSGSVATPSTPPKPAPAPKPSGGMGLVDWMNANNMNASYSNRSILAGKYGISDYKGTAIQNNQLLAKLKGGNTPTPAPAKPKPTHSGNLGLVDWMKTKGMNSGFSNRAVLAKNHGIGNYKGTASQNNQLLAKLQAQSSALSRPKVTHNSLGLVDWMKANRMDSGFGNRAKLAKQYNIANYKGTASQNTQLLAKLKR